ncbi:MAG: hypothetical protein CMP66_01290 [Flavobacteriales bacterium]|nr:hypothetical protein [Flavobacteriales bacterium]
MEKRSNIIAYFAEPAQYTLDLIKNVHDKIGVEYRFLKSNSIASKEIHNAIRTKSFSSQIRLLHKDFRNFDIIIFNGFYKRELWFFILLNLFSKNKAQIGLESDTLLNIPKHFFKRFLKKLILSFLFKRDFIYGLPGGFGTHTNLFKYYGMSDDKIVTFPMVIDNSKFQKKEHNSNFTFLFVGRFIELKNINLILQSFLKLPQEKMQFNLVGEGELFDELSARYNKPNILFLGKQYGDDLVNAYKNADCLILASKSDQWGLVVNEAMASGLPVISSKFVGANYDLIENKETGLIFDPEKEDDLTKKMLEMYQDKVQYEQFSNNAYNLMHNYWNYDLYRKQLLSVVEKMKNA